MRAQEASPRDGGSESAAPSGGGGGTGGPHRRRHRQLVRPSLSRPAAANGEIYDMEKMVAAHRTLPFDTWVRVYDLDNNKTIEVRIIDRGPFVDGRIIDLSHAAAQGDRNDRPGDGAGPHRGDPHTAGRRRAVRGAGGRLPGPRQRRADARAGWKGTTARPGCWSGRRIRTSGACWWAPNPARMGPAGWPSGSGRNLVRKGRLRRTN